MILEGNQYWNRLLWFVVLLEAKRKIETKMHKKNLSVFDHLKKFEKPI